MPIEREMEELLTFTDAGIFNSAAFFVFICTGVSPVASSTLVQGVCLRHHPLFGGAVAAVFGHLLA
jgi:hypothetical protein